MKKVPATAKRKAIDWEAVGERTRQRCNKLTDEERRRLRDYGLRLIYGADAKTPARGR